MKKFLLTTSLFFICTYVLAQKPDSILSRSEFRTEIAKLSGKIKTLEKINATLEQASAVQKKQMDSILSLLSITQSNIQQIADSLHITVTSVSSVNKQTQNQILDINQTITNRTLYWVIGILGAALLSVLVFFILRKKLSSNTRNLDSQISNTNQALQNEAWKLDSKLVEILQTQIAIVKEERKTKGAGITEGDHKLPLKVGEEIHRMRKRIANMPGDVKGLSALTNSLQRLEEEFNDSGYEMEDLLGKKYVDGMKIEARFVDNPTIPKGEEIITDVLRPEIKYKGIVIQVGKVEVGKS